MNQVIDLQRKRIVQLTEENKHNMEKQQDDYNSLIDLIDTLYTHFSKDKVVEGFNVSSQNCSNSCHKNKDTYGHQAAITDMLDICMLLCSKFSLLSVRTPTRNNCSNTIPTNNSVSSNINSNVLPNLPVPILIRGRRVHTDIVARKRFKQLYEKFQYEKTNVNETLIRVQRGFLGGISQLDIHDKSQFLQNETLNSTKYPSFANANMFFDGVMNGNFERKSEDPTYTLDSRAGG